jgi:hypothetical protein
MMATALGSRPEEWRSIYANMRVVKLSVPLQILVPAFIFPSLSKKMRGMSLFPGKTGAALGAFICAASVFLGFLLAGPLGLPGFLLSLWIVGTPGMATLATVRKPTAFVKPICVKCRLLPIIKEHEAIHLSGVAAEGPVWDSMKARHSIESLGLAGDPAICYFCPIPKRLADQ